MSRPTELEVLSAFSLHPLFMDSLRHSQFRDLRLPPSRRVVVTGLGAVSAAGIGYPALWDSLLHCRSGIAPITRFDTTGLASRIAGEVKNFDPVRLIDARLRPRRLSRQTQFALVAAEEATRDARLQSAFLRTNRVAVIIGSANSGLEAITESALRMQQKGTMRGDPNIINQGNLQASALMVSELLQTDRAFVMGISNACISGLDAVKAGSEMIRAGRFDVVICGGTDAPISRTPWAEFTLAGLNSTRNDEPERAVRPFDRERETGLLGEGSGIVVLEEAGFAEDRGAKPYVEICGESSYLDPDSTRPSGGLAQTMRGAMDNATCSDDEINFISAWGCGHPALDRIETETIKEVFGQRAYDIPVGSIKGVIGSPLAAAGALQTVVVALSYRHSVLPPTTNWEHRDVDCDLDYIAARPRRAVLRKALINAHGVGGGNTSIVLATTR